MRHFLRAPGLPVREPVTFFASQVPLPNGVDYSRAYFRGYPKTGQTPALTNGVRPPGTIATRLSRSGHSSSEL